MTRHPEEDPDDSSSTRSKVALLVGKYDLDDQADRLERQWLGEGDERRSLRELATEFNRRLVRVTLERAGLDPLEGEAENYYRLLTESEGTSGSRTQLLRRLEREGVDVEQLQSEFVSHQAVHTYLTEVRGVDYESDSDDDPVESSIRTVQRLASRGQAVTENSVEFLDRTDRVDVGNFDVTVDVQLFCRDCESGYEVTEFLRRGHCDCDS